MVETIGFADLARMLHRAAETVRAHEGELSRLDSHGGDGDHGTTMVRAMGQLEGALEEASPDDLGGALQGIGWAIMGVDGGATGPLLGSFFMAMADAAPANGAIDPPALAAMFVAALAGVRKNTRAEVGDKTMIDALVPAVEALAAAVAGGGDVNDALRAAAEAAEAGARSTTDLAARFGRAKNLGEQSKGAQDPGATSISLVFRAFSEGAEASA
jgi:dihydroxyacetone kinase-like protein